MKAIGPAGQTIIIYSHRKAHSPHGKSKPWTSDFAYSITNDAWFFGSANLDGNYTPVGSSSGVEYAWGTSWVYTGDVGEPFPIIVPYLESVQYAAAIAPGSTVTVGGLRGGVLFNAVFRPNTYWL